MRLDRINWNMMGLAGLLLVIAYGIFLRFYRITSPDLFFYDEGLYLQHNIRFLRFIESHSPESLSQLFQYVNVCWHAALADTKTIWFLLCASRVFFVGVDAVYFPRVLSAIFGVLTFVPVYLFAKNYYQSNRIAWLSVTFLAILPSHIFYSRLGMQEALSTCLFMWGMYWFFVPPRVWYKTIGTVFLLLAVIHNMLNQIQILFHLIFPWLIFLIPRFINIATFKYSIIQEKRGIIPRFSERQCCRIFETRYN